MIIDVQNSTCDYCKNTRNMRIYKCSNHYMKTLRLILTFYKSFALVSLLLTLTCLYIIYGYGKNGIYILQYLFWFKLVTIGIIYYYINSYKNAEFYYYKNLGVSKQKLWIPILFFDISFFLISAIILAAKLHETLPRS